MQLRPYQQNTYDQINSHWAAGVKNVCGVLPTGAGKTVVVSKIIEDRNEPSVAIAHRQELVGQLSVALNRANVLHKIIAPKPVIRHCVNLHNLDVGRSHYSPNSMTAVIGVDTLLRKSGITDWANKIKLWVQDEGHHVLKDNKWGKAAAMFPNAIGLGVTATPLRADGKGLGRHAHGLYDQLVVGPSMRELIDLGFLTDYRIFVPPMSIDVTDVTTGKSGDYNPKQLRAAAHKSQIVGDVVDHYLRFAAGKRAIVFATDVATAANMAANFNKKGIPAAMVCGETPDAERAALVRKLVRGELKVLTNVDLFGEGVDVPVLDVCIMARPTQSYGLYVQQFGRPLRLYDDKKFGLIIDHVGNVIRHGLPDAPRVWSLDARASRGSSSNADDAIPLRACLNPDCFAAYEAVYPVCPHCGHKPKPAERSLPEHVDGDLTELDPETLRMMRQEVEQVDLDKEIYRAQLAAKYVPKIGQLAHVRRHAERQEAQGVLRESIAWWAGYQEFLGRNDAESYRRFYHAFGCDVMTAQALNKNDALSLNLKIVKALIQSGVKQVA